MVNFRRPLKAWRYFISFVVGIAIGTGLYSECYFNKVILHSSNKIQNHDKHLDDSNPEVSAENKISSNDPSCFKRLSSTFPYRKWHGDGKKFLTAGCTVGQLSNRLKCFENTILVGSLLNRTVIIPSMDLRPIHGTPYKYKTVFNISHARSCLGDFSVFSSREIHDRSVKFNERIKVNRVICWLKRFCLSNIHRRQFILPASREIVPTDISSNATEKEFINILKKVKEKVIHLGDLYYINPLHFRIQSLVPPHLRSSTCRMLIKPHTAIFEASQSFVRQFLGTKYAAVHLRRSDFFRQNSSEINRFQMWSIDEVAECLSAKLSKLNLRLLFLATDTVGQEIKILENSMNALSHPSHHISIVQLVFDKNLTWQKDLRDAFLDTELSAIAGVEKMVCAMSMVFISTRISTFSEHILNLRGQIGKFHCEDGHICETKKWSDPIPRTNF